MNGYHIQEKISSNDILTYPLYPFISLYIFMKDSHIHTCQNYPMYILYILFIQVQYQGKISLMLANYDILTISKYVRLYPIKISVSDILCVILFGLNWLS
jgi:hypothetical protein